MRYLTLTLAPSGVDRWFVRYDKATGSIAISLYNFKQLIKNSEFC